MPRHLSLCVSAVACAALLLGATFVRAQSHDVRAEPIADHEKATIVWDVLSMEFARVDSPTKIGLSMQGLDIAWIPTIPNVDFVLLSDEDVSASEASCETYYFFDTFRRSSRWITVAFGHGTRCNNSGHVYSFRYQRGKLIRDSGGPGGFGNNGSHCGCP